MSLTKKCLTYISVRINKYIKYLKHLYLLSSPLQSKLNGSWSFRGGLDKGFYDKYLNDFTPISLRFWNLADILG